MTEESHLIDILKGEGGSWRIEHNPKTDSCTRSYQLHRTMIVARRLEKKGIIAIDHSEMAPIGEKTAVTLRLLPQAPPAYVRSDELTRGGEMTTILEDVHKALTTEAQLELIDQENLRRQEDWSHLSNKVFGAEGDSD